MVDTSFMQQKFSVEELVTHFQDEVKALREPGMQPIDENKLQVYYHAISTFKRMSIMDMVKFAMSYGRDNSPKSAQMRDALSVVLGNRVTVPSAIDLAYAKVLLAYVFAFRDGRQNLKEWLLRFVLSSRFSPLNTLLEREIMYLIENVQQKIQLYKNNLNSR